MGKWGNVGMTAAVARCSAWVVLTLGAAVLAHRDQKPPADPTGTALVVGQVVDGSTGRPVPDVAITPIRNGAARNRALVIATDADGYFVLRGLAPGSYTFEASKRGYVDGVDGATRPAGPGQAIEIKDGDRVGDVRVRLWQYAAFGGTVRDEAGEPVVGVTVRTLQRILVGGQWRLGGAAAHEFQTETDDRGMYRFSRLAPGNYVAVFPSTTTVVPTSTVSSTKALQNSADGPVAAMTALEPLMSIGVGGLNPGSSNSRQVGNFFQTNLSNSVIPPPTGDGGLFVYPTQFFPSSANASASSSLTLNSGDDRVGVDFSVKPVRTYRVSGGVIGPNGPAANMPVRLFPADADDAASDLAVAVTLSDAQGAFTLLGVPTGQYTLRAFRMPRAAMNFSSVGATVTGGFSATPSAEPTLWANVPVSVAEADVPGLSLTLNTGARLGGLIEFDGVDKPSAAALSELLHLESVDGRLIGASFLDDMVNIDSTGAFLTPELPAGQYFLRSQYVPPGWFFTSAMRGDRDIAEMPLVLGARDVTGLVVKLSDHANEVTGIVRTDQNAAATDGLICVFPADPAAWVNYGLSTRRFQQVRAAKNGVYHATALPAGEYLVAAVAEEPASDWRDPAFLTKLAQVATRIRIGDAERKSLDLRISHVSGTTLARLSGLRRAGLQVRDDGNRAMGLGLEGPRYEALTTASAHGPFVDDGAESPQTPVRDITAMTITGSGALSGTVVADDTGATPLRRAIVTLVCQDPRVGVTAVTDDAGRFAFSDLPTGRYSLTATKPAYLTTRFGASRPGHPGTPIPIDDHPGPGVTLRMLRGAVITGIAVDERGLPLRTARLEALQYRFSNGQRSLTSVARAAVPTDDHGEYRIYGLAPGEYVVAVAGTAIGNYETARRTTAGDLAAALREIQTAQSSASSTAPLPVSSPAQEFGYAPVFYPGTSVPAEAQVITLRPGEERGHVDVMVHLVPYAHVHAHVVGPDGRPPGTVQAFLVSNASVEGFDFTFPVTVNGGDLRMSSVPPGQYTLAVGGSTTVQAPQDTGGVMIVGAASSDATLALPEWAMIPVTLDGRDIDDLEIQLEQGKTMSGHVVFEGTSPPPADFKAVSIGLIGQHVHNVSTDVDLKPADAAGHFALDGIVPAKYRVSTSLSRMKGWTLKSAMINGQDAADRPVPISSDVADVVVTFTDRLTELSGTLETPTGQPAPNYHVIVFPSDRSYWVFDSRRIASLRPSTEGHFVTSGLPPGDYLIAAVTDVDNDEWFDPAFLDQLVASAVKLSLSEGEKRRQDLRITR